jgi:predicted membrane metal-binding protein
MKNTTITKLKITTFALLSIYMTVKALFDFSKYQDVNTTLSFFAVSTLISIIAILIYILRTPKDSSSFDFHNLITLMLLLPMFNIFSIAALIGWYLNDFNKMINKKLSSL